MRKTGFAVVISSPSGAGKTTVVNKLLGENNDLIRVVTATTRKPRKNEKDKRDYHFWSESKFKKAIDAKLLVERAKVYGNYYGVPKTEVDKGIKHGKIPVLVIDVQGAKTVKKLYPTSVLVFLMPPSFKELKKRLTCRKDNSKDTAKRLKIAKSEISKITMYDYVVVNDKIKNALRFLKAIIIAERLKTKRQKVKFS